MDGDAVVDSDRPRQGLDIYVSPSPARRYRGHLRRGGSSSPTDENPDGSLLQSAVGLWVGSGRRVSKGGNTGGVRLAEKEGKRVGRRASWSRWASKGKSPGGRKVGGRERGPGATKAYCEFGISSLGVFNLYILM